MFFHDDENWTVSSLQNKMVILIKNFIPSFPADLVKIVVTYVGLILPIDFHDYLTEVVTKPSKYGEIHFLPKKFDQLLFPSRCTLVDFFSIFLTESYIMEYDSLPTTKTPHNWLLDLRRIIDKFAFGDWFYVVSPNNAWTKFVIFQEKKTNQLMVTKQSTYGC